MVGTGVTLGTIAVVVAFLAAALAGFPIAGDAADMLTGAQDSETFDAKNVEDVGDALLFSYTDLIDDIVSFQDDPSLERAESRKNAMVGFAQLLTGEFKSFSDSLQGDLNDLIDQAEQMEDDASSE